MNNTSGFYKYENEILIYGPSQVTGPHYDLLRENCVDYTYPIDGWYWFDSEKEARTFFGLSIVETI